MPANPPSIEELIESLTDGDDLHSRIEAASTLRTQEDRIATLERERDARQWQPIGTFDEPTALSSGNGVLIADSDGTVGEAYFRNFDDDDRGWWWANTSWGDYPDPSRPTKPTHWKPLDEPPSLLSLDEGRD